MQLTPPGLLCYTRRYEINTFTSRTLGDAHVGRESDPGTVTLLCSPLCFLVVNLSEGIFSPVEDGLPVWTSWQTQSVFWKHHGNADCFSWAKKKKTVNCHDFHSAAFCRIYGGVVINEATALNWRVNWGEVFESPSFCVLCLVLWCKVFKASITLTRCSRTGLLAEMFLVYSLDSISTSFSISVYGEKKCLMHA